MIGEHAVLCSIVGMIRVEQVHRDRSIGAFDKVAPGADLDRAAFNRKCHHRLHQFDGVFGLPIGGRLGLVAVGIEMLAEVALAVN